MPHRLTARRRKEIAALAHKKYRTRLGQLLVEGLRSIEAAVTAEAPLVEVIVTEAAAGDARVQELLERVEVPVYVLSEAEIGALSDVQTSQGLLAVARTQLLPEAELATLRSILVLDGVQDPGNVGTMIRTAAWFGADALLAGPGTADLFNPKVVRAAMGGLWDLHLVRTADLAATLKRLHADGFALCGADLQGRPARQWTPSSPSVLVLGSEAHGLTPAVHRLLDERVVVTGAAETKGAESLNVAVAAGILVYQWLGR